MGGKQELRGWRRIGQRAQRTLDWAADNQPSWSTAVSGALIAATPIVSYFAAESKGKARVGLLAAQVIIAIALWGIPYLQKRRAEGRELEIRAEARTALSDWLDPLMEELANLANASPAARAKQQERIQTLVLTSAAQLLGGDRTRVSFYKLERAVVVRPKAAGGPIPRHQLIHVQSVGRHQAARANFVTGTEAGDFTIGKVRAKQSIFIEDVRTTPPPGWDASKTGKYKTFITMPVRAKNQALGMITVDCPEAGELEQRDEELLSVLAWVLAANLAMDARMSTSTVSRTVTGGDPRLRPMREPDR